jgi:hypothetical protein
MSFGFRHGLATYEVGRMSVTLPSSLPKLKVCSGGEDSNRLPLVLRCAGHQYREAEGKAHPGRHRGILRS